MKRFKLYFIVIIRVFQFIYHAIDYGIAYLKHKIRRKLNE